MRQPDHIENQRHVAVSHNRCARKNLEAPQLFAERFDDDFFRVIDLVHDQSKRMIVGLQHDDVRGFVQAGCGSRPALASLSSSLR